jgi:cyclopropane fatty-acyl-phospholipid synthase-like methyltransferase
MTRDSQKEYFEIAYRTGSDVWTHVPYHHIALAMVPNLPADSMTLDVGAGRGLWMGKLVAEGYRVIGIDYIHDIVKKANADIKREGYADRARMIFGDVLDIPLVDDSFDLITDIGVSQHLQASDWAQYVLELKRVIKRDGYVLNVSLSKKTPRFLGFRPKTADQSDFEKFGVHYHFFTEAELNYLFGDHGFMLIDQKTHVFESKTDPADALVLVFSLYQCKEK